MTTNNTALPINPVAAKPLSVRHMIVAAQRLIAPMFALLFLALSLFHASLAVYEFLRPILQGGDLFEGLVKGLHMGVVSLALYELAQTVYEEYEKEDGPGDTIERIRRGIMRFVSTVCIALVLEALIMVIKYSQKDLAGFLYYPVAIIASAAFLLIALGVFTRLTCPQSVRRDDRAAAGA
jgi:hypothetical protein